MSNLTAEQRQAVENRGGKLLVSAAAGSGKTKVLVDRLMLYMTDVNTHCNIDDFLIITYTKAAASELRGKIAAKMSEYLADNPKNRHIQKQMQRLYLAKISTVHSFCTDLLREYACELDLPSEFRVADENECTQLQLQAMQEVLDKAYSSSANDLDFQAFVDTQGLGRDDRLVPEIVQKVYASARCHLNPEQWLSHCVSSSQVDAVSDVAQTVWGAYLIADLHTYLQMQISAYKGCQALANADPALVKVSGLLGETICALEQLNKCQTWDEIVQKGSISYGTMRFPKKVSDPEVPKRIKAVRDTCKKGLEKKLKIFCDPSAQVLADLKQTSSAIRGLVNLTQSFSERYQQIKLRCRVLDFSDLEHKALDLLVGKDRKAPTRAAREIGERYREVLVDEYQDTNAVQDAIFSALTHQRQNCFMVGDVKQSIYQFRLADPGIFLEKYASYAPAESAVAGEGRKVLLSCNFRSGGAVLDATNDVFRRCMTTSVGGLDYGDAEALQEGLSHEPLGEPEVELHVLSTQEDTYAQEASFVASRIVQLLDGTHMVRGNDGLRPIKPDDIVILLRSPGSVGRVFQDALSARGIRSSFGNGVDLLQTEEIAVLRSILQIVSNPRQDIPLIAVLASPAFGFTADELAQIRSLKKGCLFYDALLLAEDEKSVSFREQLAKFRWTARNTTLAGLLEEILCATRLDSIYSAMENGVERTANLREFFRIAMDFEVTARRDLSQFLEHLEMLDEKGLNTGDTAIGGAVSILSIHKSKGLEYPVVFLSALSRSFNRESLRAQVLCDGELGLGLSAVDHSIRVRYPTVAKRAIVARSMKESISEEMRVLYVAMTRARDRLIMTYAGKTPEKVLAQYARSQEICGTRLLSGEVSNPGDWILMEAVNRIEAGELFAYADARPEHLHTAKHPWLIQVHDSVDTALVKTTPGAPVTRAALPAGMADALKENLTFEYAHTAATRMQSKQTPTQLKGVNAPDSDIIKLPAIRNWRRLEASKSSGSGKEYGTAMHTIMQYIRFDHCQTEEGIRAEIQRLVARGVLSEEHAARANIKAIKAFFRLKVGKSMMQGEVIREFKFSILNDANLYGENLDGEQVLLQGVVDCALIEDKGITVVDFKTDYVTADTLAEVVAKYQPQIRTYASALERIYEVPVKKCYLYFFHLRRLIPVK